MRTPTSTPFSGSASTCRELLPKGAIIDAIPARLCRLGYLGSIDRWQHAFFKYSDEKYELSVVASGSFEATSEEAFDCSAGVYLQD